MGKDSKDIKDEVTYPQNEVEHFDNVVFLAVSDVLVMVVQQRVEKIGIVGQDRQHDPADGDQDEAQPCWHRFVVIRRQIEALFVMRHF